MLTSIDVGDNWEDRVDQEHDDEHEGDCKKCLKVEISRDSQITDIIDFGADFDWIFLLQKSTAGTEFNSLTNLF